MLEPGILLKHDVPAIGGVRRVSAMLSGLVLVGLWVVTLRMAFVQALLCTENKRLILLGDAGSAIIYAKCSAPMGSAVK